MRRALMVVAALLISPSIAEGQGVPASVQRELDSLRTRTAELERRLDAVVAFLQGEPWLSKSTGGTMSQDVATWRRLRKGMNPDEVRKLLGEPRYIVGGTFAFWYYTDVATVTFYQDKVDSWAEPAP